VVASIICDTLRDFARTSGEQINFDGVDNSLDVTVTPFYLADPTRASWASVTVIEWRGRMS
jgi:hypothetical protein